MEAKQRPVRKYPIGGFNSMEKLIDAYEKDSPQAVCSAQGGGSGGEQGQQW